MTIDTPVDEVWPWLVQMGYGRGGWYTYDRLERVIGAGDFAEGGSAERILPELQSLSLGDTVAFSLSGGAIVAGLDPPRSIVLRFPMDLFTAAPASERSRAVLDWTWAPVAVGVHLGVGRGRPAERGDDECGERQRRVVLGEHAPGCGDVDLE